MRGTLFFRRHGPVLLLGGYVCTLYAACERAYLMDEKGEPLNMNEGSSRVIAILFVAMLLLTH